MRVTWSFWIVGPCYTLTRITTLTYFSRHWNTHSQFKINEDHKIRCSEHNLSYKYSNFRKRIVKIHFLFQNMWVKKHVKMFQYGIHHLTCMYCTWYNFVYISIHPPKYSYLLNNNVFIHAFQSLNKIIRQGSTHDRGHETRLGETLFILRKIF